MSSDRVISSLTIGGLTAVIYTDTIQAFLMVGGGLTLMGLGKEIRNNKSSGIEQNIKLLHLKDDGTHMSIVRNPLPVSSKRMAVQSWVSKDGV